MSLEPTPVQGLEQLHDVIVPDPVGWMPETVGWYVVAGILLLGLLWLVYGRVRQWMANRYRRTALAELRQLESRLSDPAQQVRSLAELPLLIRRTALAMAPRETVVAHTGDEWLRFLDQTGGGNEFSTGIGRYLSDLTYKPPESLSLTSEDIGNLLALIRQWIRTHRHVVNAGPVLTLSGVVEDES